MRFTSTKRLWQNEKMAVVVTLGLRAVNRLAFLSRQPCFTWEPGVSVLSPIALGCEWTAPGKVDVPGLLWHRKPNPSITPMTAGDMI